MPNLCRTMRQQSEGQKKTLFGVAEVIGQVSGKPLEEHIRAVCKEKGREGVEVQRVELKHLPPVGSQGQEGKRGEVLGDNGTFYPVPTLREGNGRGCLRGWLANLGVGGNRS